MKDRTTDFRVKLRDELHNQDEITLRFGKSEVILPKKVLYTLEKRFSYFELDGIDDIQKNYEILTKTSGIPIPFMYWGIKKIMPVMLADEEFMSIPYSLYLREYQELFKLSAPSSKGLLANYNLCFLYNVTVQNFEFTKRKTFELCEFDIFDRQDASIRAVLNYRSVPSNSANDIAREQLEQIINSSCTDHFDVQFSAMPQKYYIKKEELFRDKKLHIYDIRKRKTESEEPADIPSDITSLSPVLVG